jgi:L-alanine-DL-glutamate epimerase-like enolase superfamily enzyme
MNGKTLMKISSVRAIPLEAPLDPKSQVTAFGPRLKAGLVLVEIETEDGIRGYGEALARYSLRSYVSLIEDILAPRLVGRNPFDVEGLWQSMLRSITGKAGGLLLEAIAACDIALWDIMGKACGQPLHRMLGSMGREQVQAYASSISWDVDAIAVTQAERAVENGFSMIKIKIGAPAERALERAALIRRTVGDRIELTADGNWAFDHDTAIRVGKGLADLGFTWFEEPLIAEDVEGYQRLRAAIPLRLAAGESEHTVYGCRTLIASGAVGVIQPDVARSGGITETRRIGALAYAFNVPFAPHIGFCGAVCAAASLHLSASLPNFLTYESMIFDNALRQELAVEDVTSTKLLKNSMLPVPQGPGLGIEIDPKAIARFRIDQ